MQQSYSFGIIEQMQISITKIIAFAPAEHKVGLGQFSRFSLAVGLWLRFAEVVLIKFPVEFVCKLNQLFPHQNPLHKQYPIRIQYFWTK